MGRRSANVTPSSCWGFRSLTHNSGPNALTTMPQASAKCLPFAFLFTYVTGVTAFLPHHSCESTSSKSVPQCTLQIPTEQVKLDKYCSALSAVCSSLDKDHELCKAATKAHRDSCSNGSEFTWISSTTLGETRVDSSSVDLGDTLGSMSWSPPSPPPPSTSLAEYRNRVRSANQYTDCDMWASSMGSSYSDLDSKCHPNATQDTTARVTLNVDGIDDTGKIWNQMLVRYGMIWDGDYNQRVCGCKETYMQFREQSSGICPQGSNIGGVYCLTDSNTFSKVLGCQAVHLHGNQYGNCDHTPTLSFAFN